jgi:hypothetical protein
MAKKKRKSGSKSAADPFAFPFGANAPKRSSKGSKRRKPKGGGS